MFYTGFARLDITPSLGCPLAGASKVRYADGMLDPLELNCVAFSDGENKAVLITADFLYVMENAATEIRGLIAKKCDIPAEHVFMQGLHQHTSLRIGCKPNLGNNGYSDKAYLEMLYRKYCDVVTLALNDLKETTLLQAEEETAQPISFIRRYRMKDGKCKTNPTKGNPDIVGPIGQADNTVRLLRFVRKDAPDIALVNFSCHPDVVSGTKISADWPGFVRRYTEADLPDTKCILVNGAQGDSNHLNPAVLEREGGIKHAAYMGRVITDTVKKLWDKAQPMETGKVWGKVEMKYIPTNTKGMDHLEEYIEWNKGIGNGTREKPRDFAFACEIWRVSQLPRETLFQKVPIALLGIGKVAFVGFGGEPFTEYAAKAREAGEGLYVITACLTDGGQGYLPTKDAYDEGGYEASNSRFDASVGQILQSGVAELLAEYKNVK
ncbi:MAG: hypothetical protein E7580_02680 [Ruminococcaceae bacterium]|nr:hypothetical protein [Oscillospiraceae bacterium]